eukprot:5926988-Amphidinium_carterae.2
MHRCSKEPKIVTNWELLQITETLTLSSTPTASFSHILSLLSLRDLTNHALVPPKAVEEP